MLYINTSVFRNILLKVEPSLAFHSMNNSGLNFRKFPVVNRAAFLIISRKEVDLARYTQIFGHFVPGISVPYDSPLGISVDWKNQQISGFSGNFPRKFPDHFNMGEEI